RTVPWTCSFSQRETRHLLVRRQLQVVAALGDGRKDLWRLRARQLAFRAEAQRQHLAELAGGLQEFLGQTGGAFLAVDPDIHFLLPRAAVDGADAFIAHCNTSSRGSSSTSSRQPRNSGGSSSAAPGCRVSTASNSACSALRRHRNSGARPSSVAFFSITSRARDSLAFCSWLWGFAMGGGHSASGRARAAARRA